jgi:hypothetical protein
VVGQSKGRVGTGEAREEVPHLQDSEGTVTPNLVGEVELLKGLGVHIGEGLGWREREGKREEGISEEHSQIKNKTVEEWRTRKIIRKCPMIK